MRGLTYLLMQQLLSVVAIELLCRQRATVVSMI